MKRNKPRMVEIEVANSCNLRCEICRMKEKFGQALKTMSLDSFKKIIDHYDYPLEHIQFCGTCEPLLNEHLPEMIAYVVQKKSPKIVELITNATLLTLDKSKALIEAGITTVRVSIDGPDEKTYAAIRKTSLKAVSDNLRKFSTLASGKNISLGINCVVTSSNIDFLCNMPAFAKGLGAQSVEFRLYETKEESLGSLAVHDASTLHALKKTLKERGKSLGIAIDFWDVEKPIPCTLEDEANINWRGYLTPCYHLPDKFIGEDLSRQLFSEVWNSDKIVSLLEKIQRGAFLKECCCLLALQNKT